MCVLGAMRTGSNLLQSYLHECEGVTALGELFNPAFVGVDAPSRGYAEFAGYTRSDVARRDSSYRKFFNHIYDAAAPTTLAFRLFQGHNKEVLKTLLANKSAVKIVLTRNPLESFISLLLAKQTNQWLVTAPTARKKAKVKFIPEEYEAFKSGRRNFYDGILQELQQKKHTFAVLDYAELNDLSRVNETLSQVLPDTSLSELPQVIVKQNPGSLASKVINFEEMNSYLLANRQ